ncbi:MAG: dipeptidase [Limisphaerales bacterium]
MSTPRLKSLLPLSLLLVVSFWTTEEQSFASPRPSSQDKCTTVIVGKHATTDGSVILAHNEDWGEFEVPLRWHPPKQHRGGETVTLRGGLVLEQVSETHGYLLPAAICNGINEFQVMITDNSGSCRNEMVRRETGIEMADLVAVALQRSKTAREAVGIMGQLIDRFGYRCIDGPGGDIFSVADPSEGWWMEVTTAGPWVASRVPDDAFVVIANRFRIESVDLADPSRFLGSSNLVSYAKEMGWYDPAKGPFKFAEAYSGHRAESARREWRGNSVLGGSTLRPDESRVAVVPVRKLQPRDLMTFLRDHYEGISGETAAVEAKGSPHHTSERSICALYTDASTVAHLRGWLPNPVGGLVWLAVGTPCSSVFTPIYVGTPEFPRPYVSVTEMYDPENAYWVFNALENLVDRNYRERGASLGGGVRKGEDPVIELVAGRWKRLEDDAFAMQAAVEKTALELLRTDARLAQSFLGRYTQMMALRSFEDAKDLVDELRTRHER